MSRLSSPVPPPSVPHEPPYRRGAGRRRSAAPAAPPAPCAGPEAPEPLGIPPFDPVDVSFPRERLKRAMLRRRGAMAAGLAVTAAAFAAASAEGSGAPGKTPTPRVADARAASALAEAEPAPPRRRAQLVSAPVRIADAASVRLLKEGDLVDVIAAPLAAPGGSAVAGGEARARVIASRVRVAHIPAPESDDAGSVEGDNGALIVLSVPRAAATALAGAGATSQLTVTLC